MIRWSMPFAAQLLQNECRKMCQPRIFSHLLPASVRLKWSWASSRVSCVPRSRVFPLRGTFGPRANVYLPPGCVLRANSRKTSKQQRRQRHPTRGQLSADAFLLADEDGRTIEVDVIDFRPDHLAPPRPGVCGEHDHRVDERLPAMLRERSRAVPRSPAASGTGSPRARLLRPRSVRRERFSVRFPPTSGTAASRSVFGITQPLLRKRFAEAPLSIPQVQAERQRPKFLLDRGRAELPSPDSLSRARFSTYFCRSSKPRSSSRRRWRPARVSVGARGFACRRASSLRGSLA